MISNLFLYWKYNMKKNNINQILTAILIALIFTATCDKRKNKEPNMNHTDISEFNYSEYIKKYPGLRELQTQDLKLREDSYKTYEIKNNDGTTNIRKSAIFELFPKQIKIGMKIGDFIEKLKTAEWIEKKNLHIINSPDNLIPIQYKPGKTMAIHISDSPDEKIAIYFRTDCNAPHKSSHLT